VVDSSGCDRGRRHARSAADPQGSLGVANCVELLQTLVLGIENGHDATP